MNNTPVDTRPPATSITPSSNAQRNDTRPPPKPSELQRKAFEKLMSDDEDSDADAVTEAAPDVLTQAEGRPLPAAVFRDLKDEQHAALGAELAPSPVRELAQPMALNAAATDIPVPAPQFQPAAVQQSNLFAHLALPHGQAAELGRFEVLAGSSVSHVEVNTTPQGGLTVAIGTSVQHASLLDRYLPQLQRRLPEKVTAHVRVQDREQRRD